MSILQYKYKAHRLINTLFYVIVFVLGFVLGFGAKEIDFSKLISNVLMIDNVQAYTIYEENDITVDEEFIFEKFSINENFDIKLYSNIICSSAYSNPVGDILTCYAFKEEDIEKYLVYNRTTSLGYMFDFITSDSDFIYYKFIYELENKQFFSSTELITHSLGSTGNIVFYKENGPFSNFDLPGLDTEDNEKINVLDFVSPFLEFNENLFKDNPDFKEVCVPNNKKFTISSNNYEILDNESSSKHYKSYEFLWFPYKIEGLSTYIYDNSKENNVWVLEEDETYFEMNPGYWYWLNNKDEIDLYFSKEDPGNYLNSLGYTDKYSYYGWYFHPFLNCFAASGLRQLNVFWFKDTSQVTKLDGSVSSDYENYCFYIKKDFDVTLLNSDEFGDQYGEITILGGEQLNINTTQNAANLDSKGLFEKVKIFLNRMTKPIDFVGDNIYDLYKSMPILLKLFIISVFGLVVIKIIIGMVVK